MSLWAGEISILLDDLKEANESYSRLLATQARRELVEDAGNRLTDVWVRFCEAVKQETE